MHQLHPYYTYAETFRVYTVDCKKFPLGKYNVRIYMYVELGTISIIQ
jgi:hypothetical protein